MNGSGVQSRQPQAALEYLSSVQSKFLSRFLAVLLPSSLLLVPFTQHFHSRIAGHGKTHQHKAGGIYVVNNLIFWLTPLITRTSNAPKAGAVQLISCKKGMKGTISNLAPPSCVNLPTLLQQVLEHENTLCTPACHFPGCTAGTLCCSTGTSSVRLWCSIYTELQRFIWRTMVSLVMNEIQALWN